MPSEAIFVADVAEPAFPFSFSAEVFMLSQLRRGPLQQRGRMGAVAAAAVSAVAGGGGVDSVLLLSGASPTPPPPWTTAGAEIEEEEEEDETSETELFPASREGAVMEEAGGRREFWKRKKSCVEIHTVQHVTCLRFRRR